MYKLSLAALTLSGPDSLELYKLRHIYTLNLVGGRTNERV